MTLRAVLRGNLKALMRAAEDGKRAGPATPLELEAASNVGKSTIYRVLDEDQDLGVDNLGQLAEAYGLPAWALLLSELDPVSTPTADTQERLEARVEARAEEKAHTVLADAIHEQKLKQKASFGRRRGDKPVTARPSAKEKPPGRKLTVRK